MTALYDRTDETVNTLIQRMTENAQPQGGPALKRAVHAAREQVGITSDTELAVKAGVHYDTLMNWFSGRTTPRPAELKKIADVIGLRLVDLMDVWEGRDPRPPSLEQAIGELVDEIRALLYEHRLSRAQQEESTAAILRALGALARGAPAPSGTPAETGPGAASGSGRR